MARRRHDLWILGGLFLFALAFVFGATWLGLQKRTRYELKPLPEPSPSELQLTEELGLLTPRFSTARLWLSALPEQQEAIESATEKAASTEVPTREGLLDLAVLRLLQSRPKAALATALHANDLFPGESEVHFVVGLAHEQELKRGISDSNPIEVLSTARQHYRDALRGMPEDIDLLYRVGQVELALGNAVMQTPSAGKAPTAPSLYQSVLKVAEVLVKLSPRSPKVQMLLADACLATGDVGRAKRAFLDVLQLKPSDARAREAVRRLDGQ